MVKVSMFLNYLQNNHRILPEAKQALSNYFQNYPLKNNEVTAEALIKCFDLCSRIPYWRNQHEKLWSILKLTCMDLNKIPNSSGKMFSIPGSRQIIEVSSLDEMKVILTKHLKLDPYTSKSIVMDQDLIVVSKSSPGSLRALRFDRLCGIENGNIVPLCPKTELHYTNRLELDPQYTQRLELSLGNFAVFQPSHDGAIRGYLLSGPVLSKERGYQNALSSYPDVFYGLKLIERHFIDLKTDAFYKGLVDGLKAAIEEMKQNPNTGKKQLQTLQKGHYTVKNILPDDELLNLLVSNLEHLINKAPSEPNLQL